MSTTRKKRKVNSSGGGDDKDEILYHNVYYPSYKVHCDFCDKDITRHTKIIDAENTDIDICVNCFAQGQENAKHIKSNPYHVINKLNFPLYEDNWNAEEELLLIEGLEKYGFGNWTDIAEHIGTDKSPDDIFAHYEKIYLNSKDYLPPNELLSRRDANHNLIIKQSGSRASKQPEELENRRKKYAKQGTDKKDGALPAQTQNASGLSLTHSKDSNTNASEIVGYMPLRGDFEYEYDNEAELFLAEMEFNDDDKPEEVQTKLKILEIYNIRLDERIKRKKFVIERDMLDLKKQNTLDRIRTKEEKEIYNLLKIFARFNTPEDHEKLVQGIYREKMLRQKIEELRFYKKIGLKTFEEVELYLAEKKKKDDAYQKKQKQNDFYVYDQKIKYSNPRRTRYNARDGMESKETIEKKNKFALTQLNEKELNLCEHAGITAYEFLLIKDVLVRECLKEGYLTRDFIDNSIKLDFKDKANQIFDFLVLNKVIIEKA